MSYAYVYARALRLSHRLSIADVARQLGIPKSTYAGYESGRREFPHDILMKLSNMYYVSVDYLLTGSGSPDPVVQTGRTQALKEMHNCGEEELLHRIQKQIGESIFMDFPRMYEQSKINIVLALQVAYELEIKRRGLK